ncbi:branchpoint-bridging protein isoform X1 [Asparagus officinalis]|nr:branchpoint-bridging protein isoform X1 [Asparagus officinalis]
MTAKVDSSSPVELTHGQSTGAPAVSTSNPKISKFGAKAGFVIPKNKLSGSLVPIFRGGSKADAGTDVKEESSKQVQRKTKWGADLTQDAAVRKGRALAYQTRVEQITQQLKSGAMEIEDDQGSQSPKQDPSQQSATNHDGQQDKKFELLELEKREIIGEILRLNPSYKAPPEYKPLLKEGKVAIPVKAYPGYNFIGLLLGPESNTQKRLEEETGAKIRVYGTKANTNDKREITQSDATGPQGSYEELYVNVSADTYEKVDAAVSLIELLVTPVSGNAVVDSKNSTPVADVNQFAARPTSVSPQSGQQQFQQQYSAPWFPNARSNSALGFFPLSATNNPVRFPPHNVPYAQPRTPLPLVNRPQLPFQPMQQHPPNQVISPQHQAMPGQQPPLLYPSVSTQSNSQPPLIGPMPPPRPTPVNSSGWSSSPSVVQLQRPNTQMTPQPFNPHIRPQQASLPPQNMPSNLIRPPSNFASFSPVTPLSGPSPVLSSFGSSVQRPITPLTSIPPNINIPSSSVPAPAAAQARALSQSMVSLTRPPVPIPTSSNGALPVSAPKPLRPISGDFTFQPLRAQVPGSPTTGKPSPLPLAAPQPPSFRPAAQNLGQIPILPSPSPTPFSTNLSLSPVLPTSYFPANSVNAQPPPRFPFPNSNTGQLRPMAPANQMGPPSFSPGPRVPPSVNPMPARPPNYFQPHQTQLPLSNQPSGLVIPRSSGGNQVYDPFSPTSISSARPQQGGEGLKAQKQDTDAEYEDLMASVGVK